MLQKSSLVSAVPLVLGSRSRLKRGAIFPRWIFIRGSHLIPTFSRDYPAKNPESGIRRLPLCVKENPGKGKAAKRWKGRNTDKRGNGGGEVLKLLRETGKIFERRSNYEFVGRKTMRVMASSSCTRLRRRDIEIGRLGISAAASSPWTRTNGWTNGWMRWDTVRKKLSGVWNTGG